MKLLTKKSKLSKEDRAVRKMVISGLKQIYTTSRDFGKLYDSTTVPFHTLRITCDKAKVGIPDELPEDSKEFMRSYNATIEKLYKLMVKQSKDNRQKRVPIGHIKIFVDHVITEYDNALKKGKK